MEVKTDSVEEKLIQASFNVISKEGISRATTKKIAQEANINEITIFRKFKSKNNLINHVKEYYGNQLIKKIDKIFEFKNDDKLEFYLKKCFIGIMNLTDKEMNMIKLGMEELREITIDKQLFAKLSDSIINKLTCFFRVKIDRKEIRAVNPYVLSLNVFSIIFESIILWKVYEKTPRYDINKYSEDFLDIILNGIKSEI